MPMRDVRRSRHRLGGAGVTDRDRDSSRSAGLRLQGAAEQLAPTDDLTRRLRYCRQIYEALCEVWRRTAVDSVGADYGTIITRSTAASASIALLRSRARQLRAQPDCAEKPLLS